MAWSAPPVIVTGQIVTAAQLNIYGDDLNFLRGDQAWIAPTLTNSWANFGAGNADAAYRKFGDLILLRGTIDGGAAGSVAFTLPSGYRPTARQRFISNGQNGPAVVTVDSAGAVTVVSLNTAGDWVSLDTVAFDVL